MKDRSKYKTQKDFSDAVNKKYDGAIRVIGRFKGLKHPIIFKDRYGLRRSAKAENLLYNNIRIPFIDNAINKTAYFMNLLWHRRPNIAKLVTPESEYEKSNSKMLFNTKFGVVAMLPEQLLLGHEPTVKAAVNKKTYTEAQANKVHNNKYSYNLVDDWRRKESHPVSIVCPIHGEFKQSLDSHINGKHGCPRCAVIDKEHEQRQKQTNGDGYFVYVVKMQSFDKFEEFWKVGYTGYSTLDRFSRIPYAVVEHSFFRFDTAKKALEIESKFHTMHTNLYYKPVLYFEGYTECYNKDPLETNYFSEFELYDIV